MEIRKVRGPVKRDSLLHTTGSDLPWVVLSSKTTARAQLPLLAFNKDKESELAY